MQQRTRIKICGLTRPQDVDAAVDAGVDAIGLVFYRASPRYVNLEAAQRLVSRLPPFVTAVGLFVNAKDEGVDLVLREFPQILLQFHGDETANECRRYARPYLRAVRMSAGVDLLDLSTHYYDAQALLLDAHVEAYGGSGKVFDWSLIPDHVPRPVVLSGGLYAGNVIDGILQVRPTAVDVSSGVEVSKGIKDPLAMRQFCQAVREADRRLLDTES